MYQTTFESDIHVIEKIFSYGYKIKYVAFLSNRGPIYQVQKRGIFRYIPLKKENGKVANFLGLEKATFFLFDYMKKLTKKENGA